MGISVSPSDINGTQRFFTPSLTSMWELWLASPYSETTVISLAKSVITLWEETAVSDFMTSSVFSLVCRNLDKSRFSFGFIYIFKNNAISCSRELGMMKKINQNCSWVQCLCCFQIESLFCFVLVHLSYNVRNNRRN